MEVKQLLPITNTTLDMTTIQITTQKQNQEQEQEQEQEQIHGVHVETRRIKRISLFDDLLQYVVDDDNKVIPFPPEYSDVAMIYINFLKEGYVNQHNFNMLQDIQHNNLLYQALKLCHYLDDIDFLKFLVNLMRGSLPSHNLPSTVPDDHPPTPKYKKVYVQQSCSSYYNMVITLPENLQRDIYLLTPYALIPECYQNDTCFFELWVKTNFKAGSNVINHVIDNEYIYSTVVKFYDNNCTDIKQFKCLRTTVNVTNEPKFVSHGMSKHWERVVYHDGNKVKHVEAEYNFVDGKLHGDTKSYFNNCNIVDIHTKFENGIKNGYELQYHINGKLSVSTYYTNGKRTGDWKSWYWTGNLQIEASFDNEGNKHGVYCEYYNRTNNSKSREYHFNHGVECGTFKAWYKPPVTDGSDMNNIKPLYEHTFNDNAHYYYKEWNKDGTVKYDFVYYGDKSNLPKPFRRMKFSTFMPNSSTQVLVNYCFRH